MMGQTLILKRTGATRAWTSRLADFLAFQSAHAQKASGLDQFDCWCNSYLMALAVTGGEPGGGSLSPVGA